MRTVALAVYHDFCDVAIVADGKLSSRGGVASRPGALEFFAQSLGPNDWVALDVTGKAWAIARRSSS